MSTQANADGPVYVHFLPKKECLEAGTPWIVHSREGCHMVSHVAFYSVMNMTTGEGDPPEKVCLCGVSKHHLALEGHIDVTTDENKKVIAIIRHYGKGGSDGAAQNFSLVEAKLKKAAEDSDRLRSELNAEQIKRQKKVEDLNKLRISLSEAEKLVETTKAAQERIAEDLDKEKKKRKQRTEEASKLRQQLRDALSQIEGANKEKEGALAELTVVKEDRMQKARELKAKMRRVKKECKQVKKALAQANLAAKVGGASVISFTVDKTSMSKTGTVPSNDGDDGDADEDDEDDDEDEDDEDAENENMHPQQGSNLAFDHGNPTSGTKVDKQGGQTVSQQRVASAALPSSHPHGAKAMAMATKENIPTFAATAATIASGSSISAIAYGKASLPSSSPLNAMTGNGRDSTSPTGAYVVHKASDIASILPPYLQSASSAASYKGYGSVQMQQKLMKGKTQHPLSLQQQLLQQQQQQQQQYQQEQQLRQLQLQQLQQLQQKQALGSNSNLLLSGLSISGSGISGSFGKPITSHSLNASYHRRFKQTQYVGF